MVFQKGNKINVGTHHSEETKRRISEAVSGEKNVRLGKHFTEEHKRKIGDAQLGEKNHCFGTHHTEEHKQKISESMKINGHFPPTYHRENHPMWRGGISKSSNGYIQIWKPEHPNAINNRYVLEHRLVMEEFLGRLLLPEEQIHHINGDKTDNRIENLMLFASNSEHIKYEQQLKSA